MRDRALLAAAVMVAAPARAIAAPCVPATAAVRAALADGDASLTYCADAACWSIDLSRGTWRDGAAALPAPPVPEERDDDTGAGPGDLVVAGGDVALCDDTARTRCRHWKRPKDLREDTYRVPTYALDGDRLAITYYTGDDEDQVFWVELWDLGRGAQLMAASENWYTDVTAVRILDDAVVVDGSDCEAGCHEARIFYDPRDRDGVRRLGRVGGEAHPIDSDRLAPVAVAPHRWAFADARGREVVVEDVHSGRVAARIRLRAGDAVHAVEMLGRARGDLVVFGDGGYVAVVDPRRGKVRALRAPLCKP